VLVSDKKQKTKVIGSIPILTTTEKPDAVK